jgi:hypothetical protein
VNSKHRQTGRFSKHGAILNCNCVVRSECIYLMGCMAVSLCLTHGSGDVVYVEHRRSARAAATSVTKWITPDQELYTS